MRVHCCPYTVPSTCFNTVCLHSRGPVFPYCSWGSDKLTTLNGGRNENIKICACSQVTLSKQVSPPTSKRRPRRWEPRSSEFLRFQKRRGSQRLGRRPPGPLLSRLSVLTWLDLRGVTRLKPQLVAAAQARVRLALVPWLEQPRCHGGGDQLVAIS